MWLDSHCHVTADRFDEDREAVLERAFDMRVRVVDVMRAETLRELCKQLYLNSENISEADPPLHRDPVPRERAPEPEVVVATEVTVKEDQPPQQG